MFWRLSSFLTPRRPSCKKYFRGLVLWLSMDKVIELTQTFRPTLKIYRGSKREKCDLNFRYQFWMGATYLKYKMRRQRQWLAYLYHKFNVGRSPPLRSRRYKIHPEKRARESVESPSPRNAPSRTNIYKWLISWLKLKHGTTISPTLALCARLNWLLVRF